MKLAVELLEALIGALIVGVVVLTGTAMLIHTLFDRPEYRPDLTVPPHYITCHQDAGGNCWVKAH